MTAGRSDEMPIAERADGDAIQGTSEITGFVTYAGEGFALVRVAPETGESPAPAPVSSRRYLRGGLPAVYQESDFAMRFVGAFERVLDPLVAVIDALPAHFDPELAPLDILELAIGWLGLEHNEAQPAAELRTLVGRAAELARLRGTYDGMALALKLNFPELPLRVEDGGGVRWSVGGRLADPEPPAFVVYCDEPISKDKAASVVRVIESIRPAHVAYRLRVRGPRSERSADVQAEKRGDASDESGAS
jgi:phage tail-like protein